MSLPFRPKEEPTYRLIGTVADWGRYDFVPAKGILCSERDTGKSKLGNGTTPYSLLPYIPSQSRIIDVPWSANTLTLALTDENNLYTCNHATSTTVTLPYMAGLDLIEGSVAIHLKQGASAGQVTVTAGSNVTVEIASTVSKTRAAKSVVSLLFSRETGGTQYWSMFGDFAAS